MRDEDIMRLSAADSLRFAEAILDPPEPNAALCRAAERYRSALEWQSVNSR